MTSLRVPWELASRVQVGNRLWTLMLLVAAAGACGGGQHHEVEGLVLRVDPAKGSVTVSHDPVPGFMDAMVMPFTTSNKDELRPVRPGDRIRFRLRIDEQRSTIDRLEVLSAGPAESSGIAAPAAVPLVPIGGDVPDFTLTSHRGQRIQLSSMRGKVVVVSFIYTRCPLPDYCPRVMTNMASLRDRFRGQLGKDVVLLTVTFDPKHDTPEALTAYADRYGADVDGWHMLTGSAAEIARVCALFGVEFYPDEGMIAHSLQTAVVDRSGALRATAEGKSFSAKQLGDLVAEVVGGA